MNDLDYQQRLAVAKAAKRFRQGRMKRRDFIRFASLAGFGFSSARFLSGCGPSSRPKTSAPAPNLEELLTEDQQLFLREVGKTFRGTKLRIVTEDTPACQAIWKVTQERFFPLMGIEIEWERLPLDRVLSRVTQDTARQAGTHDIFYIDQAWIGRFINDSVNPQSLLENADFAYPGYKFDDILQPLLDNVASYQGQLGGIPIDIPIFIMMYRRDILDELGLGVPTTMAEYLQVAKSIHQAKFPEVAGTCGQWQPGSYALNCDMTAWLWAFGGSIFGKDNQPAINDENAIAGLEYMMELGQYMPPEAIISDWEGQGHAFMQGKVGMYISWTSYFSMFDDPAHSKIVGLAEAAPCPQEAALRAPGDCSFGEVPGISHQGGSCLMLSRHSKNIDAAWIFLQWITSPEISLLASLESGSSGIRRSTYEHPLTQQQAVVAPNTTRHMDVVLDSILNRMGTEPHLPNWVQLATGDFPTELGKMVTQQQSVKATADRIATLTQQAIQTS
ncbi:ABC transporter substrate-binding protein [Leptothoe kymatousa]|uniref:Extracellular solute-binding protein n=1 Tax=Leptothoe kymatousa TAU-MAC 1615 TaxID=2364775 RepID=A0ABS5Y4P3_9CYAN|nr:extracellular solute-binding protein [Leptothoe kymatousa]MBT9312797.1 extracellular solute-binding protein [Leptothoe kymatousa TAU-MAC 1615]